MYKSFLFIAFAIISLTDISAQQVTNVNSSEFSKLIESGEGIILDVRTPQEYSQGHINNSTMISTNDPKFVEKVSLLQKDKPIYVYCLTGSRSRAVANYLSKNGYSKIYNLSRGIMEWQSAGYSVVKSAGPVKNENKSYTVTEFQQLIAKNKLVLVDFHATWCSPCKQMAPDIEKLKTNYKDKALVEKVEVQANKALQSSYNVTSIPELILFKNGKEIWRHTGIASYEELAKVLDTNQ